MIRLYRVRGQAIAAFFEIDATVKNRVLAADTAENLGIPSGSELVLLTVDRDVWYSLTTTAEVADADTEEFSFLPAGTLDHPIALTGEEADISVISESAAKVVGKFFTEE